MIQVRPSNSRSLERLLPAPLLHLLVMTREQDPRDLQSFKVGRAGIVGVVEESVVKAILLDGTLRQRAREHPQQGVDQHHRRQFPPRDHKIANADLLVNPMLDHPLIDTLVVTAHQNQA